MGTRPFLRRRLGREMAALRAQTKLTSEQVSKQADLTASTVTRIEKATLAVRVNTIKAILDVYEVAGDRRNAIVELAREANSDTWWHSYTSGGTLPKWFEVYVDLEAEADKLAIFDAQFVNGLVQTENYARSIYLSARPDASEEDIDRLVRLRLDRQKRLMAGELSLRLILDEWVLHRVYGDREIMAGQYQHLLEIAALRRVSLQILPISAQPAVVGSFHMLNFPGEDDAPVVYIEHEVGALYLEKPAQIREYTRAYDSLRADALSPKDSVALIAKVAKET